MDLKQLIRQVNLRRMAEDAGAHFEYKGKDYRSACPLHKGDNRTAFAVYEPDDLDHWTWRCYTGCNKGGDALEFFMAWKGITDYKQAIIELAEYEGVELDWKADPKQIEEIQQQKLRTNVMDEATRYYEAQLWKTPHALEYARSRGFTDQTLKEAHWGYSDSGNGLHDHLKQNGFDVALAMSMGLIRQADLCDFTANSKGRELGPQGYIVFSHRVGQHTHYFTSRVIPYIGPNPDPKKTKLSMPGSIIPYRAECGGKFAGHVVVIEGQSDADTLRQYGFSAWAMCGLAGIKAKSREMEDLKRKKAVYLAPDSDEAGEKTVTEVSSRLVDLCRELGPMTMILPKLEAAKDFNAWLTSEKPPTAKDIEAMLEKARTWYELRLEQASTCSPVDRDQRMLEIGHMLVAIPETSQSWAVRRAKEILGITKKDVTDLVHAARSKQNGHILSDIYNNQLRFVGKPLGNFWARIKEELSREDGMSKPQIKFVIEGGLASGERLPDIEIEASEFQSLSWIARDWGYSPVLHVRRGEIFEVIRAIQEVSTDVKKVRVFTYTGWVTINGKWSYLSQTGSISADGFDPTTRVDLGDNNLKYYALPAPPEGQAAYDAVQASLEFLKVGSRSVTSVIWAAMYAAPLTTIKPLMAVLWPYGTTQSGKTTVSGLGLGHFGSGFIEGHIIKAPIEFSMSTYASIEGAAFKVKDMPLIVDDYVPKNASPQEARTQAVIAQMLIRAVGNRSARGRSDASLNERRTRVPRGMVIATAENPLAGQSTVGRMLYVPVSRTDVFGQTGTNPLLDEAQQKAGAGLYASAMSIYIRWLAQHWEEVLEDFETKVENASNRLRKEKPGLQNRLYEYYALLSEASALALEAFEDMGFISIHDMRSIQEANRKAILELVVKQAETISAESPVRKVFMALSSLIRTRRGYLATRKGEPRPYPQGATDPETGTIHPPQGAQLLGWYDPENPNELYFDTDVILTAAKNYWKALDDNLDIFPDTLKRQMDQAQVLARRGDTAHIEARININGTLDRVLVVNPGMVESLYDVQMMPKAENLSDD